ncbi:MAG: hypothetical protein IT330_03375 [Anaerolineae bacterium]|nr:hypothetical protein [Anaerolineae bacterium]
MMAKLTSRRYMPIAFLLRLWLVTVILVSQLSPLLTPPATAAPRADVLQTLGDFLSLGANTVRELQEAITLASGEVRAILEQLNSDINAMIQTLSRTYQDNLNITIDSLDAATRNKLLELQALIDQVNEKLQEDIRLASQEAQNVIRRASLEIRRATVELEQSLRNVIVIGGETVAYVVDRTIYNAILVIALVFLGLGFLLFIWLLFSRRLPGGLAGVLVLLFIAAYVALFGALVLVPPVRGYAMTFTGIGLEQRLEKTASKPRILEIIPDTIILGRTNEVDVWGSTLLVEGRSPTAKIADQAVPVSAASEQRVVVNVSGLAAPEGSTNLALLYDGTPGPSEVVRLARLTPTPAPPDLAIVGFVINPTSPIHRGNARATITVRNQGSGRSGSFVLQWKPYAAHTGLSRSVPGLNAAEAQSFTFDFANYPSPGTYDSIAIVDPFNSVAETNEANNSLTRQITVRQPPPRRARITVTITRVTIHDDSDGAFKGAGDIWLDFNISGQRGRFPSSGTKDMSSGKTYDINRGFTVTLAEDERLTVFVNGTDVDDVDEDDALGTVSREYRSTDSPQWGSGSHSDRSRNPDKYTIHYTVSVTWLQ